MIVALTGYRGCGKSSVARELERLTGATVYDTDAMALEDSGRETIANIFEQDGEDTFRDLEVDAVATAAGMAGRGEDVVIALGGGALTERPVNVDVLQDAGVTIVYLRCTAETLRARIAADVDTDASRPPLTTGTATDEVAVVLARRGPLYEAAADHVLDADDATPAELAAQVQALAS